MITIIMLYVKIKILTRQKETDVKDVSMITIMLYVKIKILTRQLGVL